MRYIPSLLAVGLTLGTLAGCDKEEDKPKANDKPALPGNNMVERGQSAVDMARDAVSATNDQIAGGISAKLEQVTQYIKDHKMDLAERLLSEIESQKAVLSTDLKAKVEQLRKQLETAK